MSTIAERGYAHPDKLVSTDWVAENLNNPAIRIIESNEDEIAVSLRSHPQRGRSGLDERPQ
jgi:thiosulfate/3-mercaptopyruvate sulfurtransferase